MEFEEWWDKEIKIEPVWQGILKEHGGMLRVFCEEAYQAGQADQREKDAILAQNIANSYTFKNGSAIPARANDIAKAIRGS